MSVSVQVHLNHSLPILALGTADGYRPLPPCSVLIPSSSASAVAEIGPTSPTLSCEPTVGELLYNSQPTAGRCSPTAAVSTNREACRRLAHRKQCPSLSLLKAKRQCARSCNEEAASGMLCLSGGERAHAQLRRNQTGLPGSRVRMSCPLVAFSNGDVLLANRWSVRGAPRQPPEPAQEPGMAISPPSQSLLRACLSSPLFRRKICFAAGPRHPIGVSTPPPMVLTAARLPASLPSTRSR